MDRSLTWKIDSATAGKTRFLVTGELTENANLSALAAEGSKEIILDLGGITRINSPGVREWIAFVNDLNERRTHMVLEKCSVPFVNQLNMISNFRGKGDVASVYAPYFCPQCAKEERRLIVLSSDPRAQIEAPFPCPACATPMDFDDLLDAFLAFAG
jgi:anti-anti-sigma regulatory factor